MSEFEQFTCKGWNDETVYGYVVKPYGFEPAKRYPIAFVVHGGPQVGFGNLWTYRWNARSEERRVGKEWRSGRGRAIVNDKAGMNGWNLWVGDATMGVLH